MERVTEQQLLSAIRRHCLECSGRSPQNVRACKMKECALWQYRAPDAAVPKTKKDRSGQVDFLGILTAT